MTMPPVLGQCPVCNHPLHVQRLHCVNCQTSVEGNFALGRFHRLSTEHLEFVEVFLKNRGVIKDVEAELNISYPTVRARLDDALRAMGYGDDGDAPRGRQAQARAREDRRQVLEDLRERKINAEEAARRLASGT